MIIHPLNPADCFTAVIDREIRNQGLPGNLCAFVVELDKMPEIDAMQRQLNAFVKHNPICTATLEKRGRRYYWNESANSSLDIQLHQSDFDKETPANGLECLAEILNHKETNSLQHPLQFHLIPHRQSWLLAMLWLHPLCDAKGAELILSQLCKAPNIYRDVAPDKNNSPPIDRYLAGWRWWKKILMFHKANRYIRKQLDTQSSIQPGIVVDQSVPLKLKFKIVRFAPERSAEINTLAKKHMGIAGITLYPIGCLMRAIEKTGPRQPGEAYCFPHAFNLRKRKAQSPIFGNQVSFLFAQASQSQVKDRKQLFDQLKSQYTQAIRRQLDLAFIPLLLAGSWLSDERYAKVIRQSAPGIERASCWFSDIGETEISQREFFGSQITGMFNLCQITSPPGLCLLISRFDGKLTMVYNYLSPQISDQWLDQLVQNMENELTEQTI